VSDDFHKPPQRSQVFEFPPSRTAISDDLHKPLVRLARAGGKQFLPETKDSEKQSPPKLMSEKEKLEFREALAKAKLSGNRRMIHGAGIWDLLLPLLQRPINLNLGIVVDLPSNLYGFQTKGVEFLLDTETVLLGDDMGTGKTVQAAVALRILFQTGKIRTALIICPVSVIPNWSRELEKWAGNLAVITAGIVNSVRASLPRLLRGKTF
jgi:SNF2 family DNA or RNA helicase